MKELKKVSFVIPCYNSSKTIGKVIDEIKETMQQIAKYEYEIILVNDCSNDSSAEICDSYMLKDSRIKVIHRKEKGGEGGAKARNNGFAESRGSVIYFMDSDDYIDPTAYQEIKSVILQHAPDCIDFGWRYIHNGEAMPAAFHNLPKNTILGKETLLERVLPPLLNLRWDPDHFIFDFCCNKVFLADIIRSHGVLFDVDKPVWEDRTFLLRCLKHSKTYYPMDRCFYNYVDIPGSLSRRYSMDFFKIILANFRHYRTLFGDQFDFDTQYVNDYWCHAIENMISRSLEQKENTEQIRQNILLTLADPQVVHWYAKRHPKNAFEKKTSRLVTGNQACKALNCYAHKHKIKQCQQALTKHIVLVKRALKKMVKRITR